MKAIRGKSPSGTRTQRPWHGHTVLFQLHSLTLPRSAYVVKLQQGISTEQKRRYLELMLSYGGERTCTRIGDFSSVHGHLGERNGPNTTFVKTSILIRINDFPVNSVQSSMLTLHRGDHSIAVFMKCGTLPSFCEFQEGYRPRRQGFGSGHIPHVSK